MVGHVCVDRVTSLQIKGVSIFCYVRLLWVRVSFNLLEHHRSKAQALFFTYFDVLIDQGRGVTKGATLFQTGAVS